MTEGGRKLETVRITNSPAALRREIAKAGDHPRVVAGATYGWYWAADVLEEAGAEVHLAHPLGVRAFTCRRGSKTTSVTPQTWPTCCGWAGCPKRGSRRRRSGSCASTCRELPFCAVARYPQGEHGPSNPGLVKTDRQAPDPGLLFCPHVCSTFARLGRFA